MTSFQAANDVEHISHREERKYKKLQTCLGIQISPREGALVTCTSREEEVQVHGLHNHNPLKTVIGHTIIQS